MESTRYPSNLDEELDSLLKDGYRLDMIMPADDPREAIVSKGRDQIRLSTSDNPKSKTQNPKSTGRAGMEYRDLIPDRLGGRVVASHIRINKGGEVADYVHYHKLRFQMIYCKSGSIQVVYEDQGPPFVLQPGDCILQPPGIRHRVLESTAGAEVIEVSSPAEHETWTDHDLELPTHEIKSERYFAGQRFVRHVAANANWIRCEGYEYTDTGIAGATQDVADVRIIRLRAGIDLREQRIKLQCRTEQFNFVLIGSVSFMMSGKQVLDLAENDSCVLPATDGYEIVASGGCEILQVTLPTV
jgi:quercetin dioxygenase-like cupin family protein